MMISKALFRVWVVLFALLCRCSYFSRGKVLFPVNSSSCNLKVPHWLKFWKRPSPINDSLSIVETQETNNNDSVCYLPKGISNLRNTCYMNAVVQSLYHCHPFRERLLNTSYTESSVGYILQRLFHLLEDVDQASTSDITHQMQQLAQALEIDIRIQEDAQEFFLKIINSIDGSKTDEPTSSSNVKHMFLGKMKQSIACINVNFSKSRSQKFIDLSVKVIDNDDLLQGINELLEPEMLDGDNQYKAGEFGYQDATRQCMIESLPEVLCVHLKRFQYDADSEKMKKVGSPMTFPFLLSLTGLINNAQPEAVYDLSSVIIHEGSLNYGHYTCLSRIEHKDDDGMLLKRWYEFNDDLVSVIQEDDVKKLGYGDTRRSLSTSKNAYMLMYSRRKD